MKLFPHLTLVLLGLNGGRAINFLQHVGICAMCARAHVWVCDCKCTTFICRYIYLHNFTRVGDNSRQKRLWNIVLYIASCRHSAKCSSAHRVWQEHGKGVAAHITTTRYNIYLSFTFNEFELYGCRHHFTRFPCSSHSVLSLTWYRHEYIQILHLRRRQRHNHGNRFIIRCHLIELMTGDENGASIYLQTSPIQCECIL